MVSMHVYVKTVYYVIGSECMVNSTCIVHASIILVFAWHVCIV